MEAVLDTTVTLKGTEHTVPTDTDPVAFSASDRERLYYLKEDVYDLLCCVRVLTKGQAWRYFAGVPQEDVSKCLHKLVKDNQAYILSEEEELVEKTNEKYTVDSRMADPEMFRNRADGTFKNLTREREERKMLDDICEAFYLFLMMKEKGDAAGPYTLNVPGCPELIFAFTMNKEAYEVLCVHAGNEQDLATLPIQDKQTPEVKPQRIVMIDDEAQISEIESYGVGGIRFFAVMHGNGEFDLKAKK